MLDITTECSTNSAPVCHPRVLVRDLIRDSVWMPPANHATSSPRLTILLPTYRRCKSGLFANCVESLLTQTLTDFELLIIDDASTDGTFDQIQEFMARDPRVGCVRHQCNIGLPAISCFEGYQHARGELIGFAFDDNEFYPDAYQDLIKEIDRDNRHIVYGHVDYVFPKGEQKVEVRHKFGYGDVPSSNLFWGNYIANNAILARKIVFETVGWYDPHVLIARLCDWDLWRRVIEKYEMISVDVSVGKELGPTQSDSLGNTYSMNRWAIEEWMRRPNRTQGLLPGAYPDYDVLATVPESSVYLKTVIDETIALFSGKPWLSNHKFGDGMDILVVTAGFSASVALYFSGVSWLNARVRIISHRIDWKNLCGARAVIFVRDLTEYSLWIERCRELNIPHYFFLDDNFGELAFDEHFPEYRPWQDLDGIRKTLSSFSGVLLSTPALVDWFRTNNMHPNLIEYPPVLHEITTEEQSKVPPRHGDFRIVFIGGSHRREALLEWVVPALERLAKNRPITLVVSGVERNDFVQVSCPGLTVVPIKGSPSYAQLLQRLLGADLDVLVHPGSDNPNNSYKTINVCLNGVILNAAVVTSAIPPFTNATEPILRTCSNDIDDWFRVLDELMQHPDQIETLRQCNQAFCERNYSGSLNLAVLDSIAAAFPAAGVLAREARYTKLLQPKPVERPSPPPSNRVLLIRLIKTIARNRLRAFGNHRFVAFFYVPIRNVRWMRRFINRLLDTQAH